MGFILLPAYNLCKLSVFSLLLLLNCVITVFTYVTLNVQPDIIRINQNINITCTVHGIDIINSNLTRQWSKGPDLICYNGHPIDSIKYLEILTARNQFKLQIKNITESDVNYKYQCRYGFDSQAKNIQASKDNFEYQRKITVSYTNRPDYIDFVCNVAGKPNNYTFLQWEHESEYHEQIRSFNGTRNGTLRVKKTKNLSKQYEDSGYYICRVSNGIPDLNGKKTQEGMAFLPVAGPPELLLGNMKVQYGAFGNITRLWVQIYSDSEILSSTIRRYDGKNNVTLYHKKTKVLGYVIFHGVKVMVVGTKLHFDIHINNYNDFNNYTINVCNKQGCINMTLELRIDNYSNKTVNYNSLCWQIMGILLGGNLFFSICWNIYCYLRYKKKGIDTNIPLEVQYDEIGNISFTSANIQVVQNNAQEAVSIVDLPTLELFDNTGLSLEISCSSNSSVQSQSISLLSEDGYEQPYQTIDSGNIGVHPYSTVWSNLYQNTTVFPNQIEIVTAYAKERDPWVIIYKKNIRYTRETCTSTCIDKDPNKPPE